MNNPQPSPSSSRPSPDPERREWNWREAYERGDAVWVSRPEGIGNPWSWSAPIQAIVQDSHKFKHLRAGEWTDLLELCEGFLNNLYDRGFMLIEATDTDVQEERSDHMNENARKVVNTMLRLMDDEDWGEDDFDGLIHEAYEIRGMERPSVRRASDGA